MTQYTEEQSSEDDGNPMVIVKEKKYVKMIVEIKKLVGNRMLSLEPPDLLELFIYCHYILRRGKQDTLQGVLTDGLNWHCFDLRLRDGSVLMDLTRYTSVSCKSEREVIGTLPLLLSE